ncbi:MAG: 50S ribosomal protein L29 [Kiritimatiellae bacterium]|nr:50S ribosomal protein L29 [Kiritimatiellia bacterium]
MKAKEIREIGADELAQKIVETKKEMAKMRMRRASGVSVENYGKIRGMRRDVARMLTIQTERAKKEGK